MVVGIGVDLIEVERIRKILEKTPRFLTRIFTADEADYCLKKTNTHQHLAARFAAKEAFFKALGRRISWREVEVLNLPSGKPQIRFHSRDKLPFEEAHVSISHLAEYALAMVILEGQG